METTSGKSVINRPTDCGRAESQSKAGMISYISFGWTSSFLLTGRRNYVFHWNGPNNRQDENCQFHSAYVSRDAFQSLTASQVSQSRSPREGTKAGETNFSIPPSKGRSVKHRNMKNMRALDPLADFQAPTICTGLHPTPTLALVILRSRMNGAIHPDSIFLHMA